MQEVGHILDKILIYKQEAEQSILIFLTKLLIMKITVNYLDEKHTDSPS